MKDEQFWLEVLRTHEALFRQFAEEIKDGASYYDMGRQAAYFEVAECLAFVLEDNKELAS